MRSVGGVATRIAWRPRSIPERLALVGLACAGAAAAYPAVSGATGVRSVCPLRAITGIPCPLCGMTTAATALAHGDLGASLAANPFLLLLALGTAVMTVVMAGRLSGRLPPPRPLAPATERRVWLLVAALALGSWAVQLARFGWLSPLWW